MGDFSRRLRALAAEGRAVAVPDAHDVLVAKLAASLGFEALYVGSLGLSASRFGLPDQSLLGTNQLIDQARIVAASVDVPVCLDFEDGGGNAVTTHRNVALAEAAGVAAIQIEDQVPGKLYGRGGQLHPVGVAAEKIRAACEARRDPDTIVIGRTEALVIGLSEQEAIDRVAAYAEAGADMVTVTYLPAQRVAQYAAKIGRPFANFAVAETDAELKAAGLGLAIYTGQSLAAHYLAAAECLRRIRDQGVGQPLNLFIQALTETNALLGGPENAALAARYGVV